MRAPTARGRAPPSPARFSTGDPDFGDGMAATLGDYEEATAAAGSDGAFVKSTESAAGESDDNGWDHGYGDGDG